MQKEVYTEIDLVVLRVTERAIKVDNLGDETWIPRSVLHSQSDRDVDGASPGSELTLKVMTWKLDQLGWA